MKIQSALANRFESLLEASGLDRHTRDVLMLRFRRSEDDLFGPLEELYGADTRYASVRDELLVALVEAQRERPDELSPARPQA